MSVYDKYPSVGYDPGGKWCAFYFGLNAVLARFVETKEQLKEPVSERISRSDRFHREWEIKFPAKEDFDGIFDEQKLGACKQFSKALEKIGLNVSNGKVTLEMKAANLCPVLMIEALRGVILSSDLHNAQTPNLALPMWAYGFSVLKRIYSAYGLPTDFLPQISFDKEGMAFEVPFLMPTLSSAQQNSLALRAEDCRSVFSSFLECESSPVISYQPFLVNGVRTGVVSAKSPNASHKFAGIIRNSSGDYVKRNRTAVASFTLAAVQAGYSYMANGNRR